MRRLVQTLLFCAACVLMSAQLAVAGQWTCPVGGESFPYDSRDSAHMAQWKQRHIEAHRAQQGGGSDFYSGMSGLPSTGDPAFDAMLPFIQQGAHALGQELGKALFGDPAAERRKAELQRLEEERQAELRRQREAELERQRRAAHERLVQDLVVLDTSGSGSLALTEIDFDGRRASESLPLLGLDGELSPAGTAFFGTGRAESRAAHSDPSVVDLRGLPSYGTAAPAAAARTQGFGAMTEVPAPQIEGNVATARNGREALQRIEELEARIASLPGSERAPARQQLETLKRKAVIIEHYDQIMNAFNGKRVDSMRDMAQARAAAAEARKKFGEEALSTLEAAVGDFRTAGEQLLDSGVWKQLNRALKLEGDISSANSLAQDLAALNALGRGQATDAVTWAKLTERASDLMLKLTVADGVLVRKYGEVRAKQILGRASFWIKAGRGLAESTRHSMDLLLLHQETAFLSDDLGDSAARQRRFHERYAQKIREFHSGRRQLETILATPLATANR